MSSLRLTRWIVAAAMALTMALATAWAPLAPVLAQENQVARTTEGDITRYASLRADDVNVRAGPGVRYPVKWKFVQKNMPVQKLKSGVPGLKPVSSPMAGPTTRGAIRIS